MCLNNRIEFWGPSTASRIERKQEDEEKRKRHDNNSGKRIDLDVCML